MNKTIYSVDGFTETTLEFEKIDFVGTEDIKALLREVTDGVVITARRDIGVYASPAILGDVVDTRTRFIIQGRAYTFKNQKYVITQADIDRETMVISYVDGQAMLVKGEKFKEFYELDDKKWELYKSIDLPKKYVTVTKNIYFRTSWGEVLFAPAGSKLCLELVEKRDFYVVTNSLFKVAYSLTGETERLEDMEII